MLFKRLINIQYDIQVSGPQYRQVKAGSFFSNGITGSRSVNLNAKLQRRHVVHVVVLSQYTKLSPLVITVVLRPTSISGLQSVCKSGPARETGCVLLLGQSKNTVHTI